MVVISACTPYVYELRHTTLPTPATLAVVTDPARIVVLHRGNQVARLEAPQLVGQQLLATIQPLVEPAVSRYQAAEPPYGYRLQDSATLRRIVHVYAYRIHNPHKGQVAIDLDQVTHLATVYLPIIPVADIQGQSGAIRRPGAKRMPVGQQLKVVGGAAISVLIFLFTVWII